jgi:hypothetical protein
MSDMDITEFRSVGYLHEVNRLVLHPSGLALVVEAGEDGERISGVMDNRDDPEGIILGPDLLDPDKAHRVSLIWNGRMPAREEALGFMIQPIEGLPELNLSYEDVAKILKAFEAAGPAWVPGQLRAKLELFMRKVEVAHGG